MKDFASTLLSARDSLLAEFAAEARSTREQLIHLDALLEQAGLDIASLPSLGDAAEGVLSAAKRKPGRPAKAAGARKKPGPKPGRKKTTAKKKMGKRGGRKKTDFNATAAVRDIVADMKKPFTIQDLRAEFEKRHPGVLETLNRIVLSLAMQSLTRRGEVTAKKDPNSKGNIFTKKK